MGKTNIDKKDIAKSLYLNGNFTQEEIADKVAASYRETDIEALSFDKVSFIVVVSRSLKVLLLLL